MLSVPVVCNGIFQQQHRIKVPETNSLERETGSMLTEALQGPANWDTDTELETRCADAT
jgi:hypothetical protein